MGKNLPPQDINEENPEGLVDALIIINSSSTHDDYLPQDIRVRILGAGLLDDLGVLGRDGKIIFSSNPPPKPDKLSRARLMQEHLQNIFKDISKKSVVLEDTKENAKDEAEEIKKIIKKYKIKNLGLISTSAIHNEDVQKAFKKAGLALEPIPPETILAKKFPDFIGNVKKSPRFLKELGKEVIEKFIRSHRMLQSIYVSRVALI